MIGYMIDQELGNLLPVERPLATILTMVEIDREDPAFQNPTKPIGPVYAEDEAHALAAERGWNIAPDGEGWRRVVPSPLPKRIFEVRPVRWLLEHNVIVICSGGGIPTAYDDQKKLCGVEAVIDKDRASTLLAEEIQADCLILAAFVSGGTMGAAGMLLSQWVLRKMSPPPHHRPGNVDMWKIEVMKADVADIAVQLHSVDARLDFTEQLLEGALSGAQPPPPRPPPASLPMQSLSSQTLPTQTLPTQALPPQALPSQRDEAPQSAVSSETQGDPPDGLRASSVGGDSPAS